MYELEADTTTAPAIALPRVTGGGGDRVKEDRER
jgi:hypothetical protein